MGAGARTRGRDGARLPRGVRGDGRHRGLDRRVRDGRAERPLAAGQVRRAVRSVRRRDPAPRDAKAPRALPGRRDLARPARLLRDDRDGPRLERPGRRDHRHLRRRGRGVRGLDARRGIAQGLHRQRRRARPDGSGVLPAHRRRRGRRARRVARRPLPAGADPRREGAPARRRRALRLRPQGRPERRRQRADRVPRRPRAARRPARPLRRGPRRRLLLQRDREPEPALLHDARHAHPGPGERRRRLDQRREGRPDDRGPPRRPAAPVRPAGLRSRGAAARLPGAPAAPAAGAGEDLRAPLHAARADRGARAGLHDGRLPGAGPPRAGGTGRRAQGARELARHGHDPDLPGVLRRRRVPDREPLRRAARRHRRLHDVRGRQHRSSSSSSPRAS